MKDQELKGIYNNYFSETMKASKEYQRRFNEAVDMQKPFTDNLSNVDKQVFDKIVESFITCEDQLLEDTFVYAVKYAYKIFKEIES